MKTKMMLGLAPLGFLLGGCVTAKDIQAGLAPTVLESVGAVRADTCPEQQAPQGEIALSMRAAPVAAIAPLSLTAMGIDPGATDLEVGRQLVELSTRADKRALVGGYIQMLGVNLAAFSGKLDDIDVAGADLALEALTSEGLKQALSVQDAGGQVGDGPTEVSISREQWSRTEYLVNKATMENGWSADFARSLGRFAKTQSALSDTDRDTEVLKLQRKSLVAAYMIAYFRNGEVFTVNFDDDALTKKLKADLKDKFANETLRAEAEKQLDAFAATLEKGLCQAAKADTCRIMGVLGETTFVTRAGASHAFTGLNVTVDVTKDDAISTNKLDPDVIAPDLVRVVVEGLGDQISTIPGAKNSTLCATLPKRCAGTSDAEKLAISRVNDVGDRTEAGTMAAVGAAIRGGWLFSLNNETVAATLTTGVAVAARKAAEAATWKVAASGGSCRAVTADKQLAYRQITYAVRP